MDRYLFILSRDPFTARDIDGIHATARDRAEALRFR